MAEEVVMKPVAPLVSKKFVDLAEELALIEDAYLKEVKIDRIIAKLQRKYRTLDQGQKEQFQVLSGEDNVQEFARKIKAQEPTSYVKSIQEHEALWNFLDREKGRAITYNTLYSDHEDQVQEVYRAYDKNLKPKDYLESFSSFIKQNRNEIAALNIICTKPGSLKRKELKELKIILDEKGFNTTRLNTAFKEVSNQEIVADIIAHIRTAALNTALIGHEERIRKAVDLVKTKHQWTQIQLRWLDKIAAQLMKETVISVEDLNEPPFSLDGGLKRLNKVFKDETTTLINELNEYLYEQA
jgi:type I restriction enzyme R subunit